MDTFGLPPATLILILANVVISVAALAVRPILDGGMLTTVNVRQGGDYYRLISSGFLHAGPLHLIVNMFTLFFFGPSLEQVLGSQRFLIVYLGALLAGSVFALVRNWSNPRYAALGASGAVSGVVLAVCLYIPFNMVYLFAILPMPLIVFAVLYILYSVYGMGKENRVIGHEAHLGGAIGGVLLTLIVDPRAITIFLNEIRQLTG